VMYEAQLRQKSHSNQVNLPDQRKPFHSHMKYLIAWFPIQIIGYRL